MRPLAVGLFFSCVCAAPGYAGSVLQSQATGLARATSSLQPEVTGTADTGLRVSLRSHDYGREDRLYETVLPAQTAFEAYALGVLNLQGTFLVPVEVKRGPDRVDLDLLLANEWAFANQREPPRLTRSESVPLVRGELGTCRPGVAIAGQRLTVISCLQGQATTSVIDAHQLKPQLCRVGLDEVSGARPCGVSTRDGSISCAESASWRACVHRGEPTLTSGWWQPRQRPGRDLESGLFFEPMGMTGLTAYQPVIEGPLFENDGVVRVAFGQGDGGVEWREIPAPKAGTGQVQLKALVERGGSMATNERWRLASGAIVQMNQGGVEATGSREGVVAFPSLDGGSAEVTLIDSGRAALLGSMLFIDAARDIGGDMSGDSEDLATPKGARVITHTSAGAFEVGRLEAVNLGTHQRIDTPWDSHSPATAGRGRFVVFARPTDPKQHNELFVWDLQTGEQRSLGQADGPVRYGRSGDEVWVARRTAAGRELVSVNGTTGEVTPRADKAPPLRATSLMPWLGKPLPSEACPRVWQTTDGRSILTGAGEPSCESVLRAPGLLFTNDGLWVWPRGMRLRGTR